MSRARRVRRRRLRHVVLASAAVVGGTPIFLGLHASSFAHRVSMATAYVALALLSITLLLGPLNMLRGRPNPVSFDLRRDVGIWGALASLAHVVAGLNVHMEGRYVAYFLSPDAEGGVALRLDGFGLTNHVGLLVILLVLVLLALSNDLSLRRMGPVRWKRWQRLNYLTYVGLLFHALVYQRLEDRPLPWVLATLGLASTVVVVQGAGVRRFRLTRPGD